MPRSFLLFCFVLLCLQQTCSGIRPFRAQGSKQKQQDVESIIRENYLLPRDRGRDDDGESLDWIQELTKNELRKRAGGRKVNEYCWVPEGRDSCAPQFIIAGSMKCGTTSLHTYLLNHPQVLPLVEGAQLAGKEVLAMKEIRFFNDPTFKRLYQKKGLKESLNDYYSLFRDMPIPQEEDNSTLPMISGDATPMYVVRSWYTFRYMKLMLYFV